METTVTRLAGRAGVFPTQAPAGADWRTEAIRAYRRSEPESAAALARGILIAVRRITGHTLDPRTIAVDQQGRTATAALSGVRFRWAHGQLAVVRPCAHCGQGAFTSGPVHDLPGLGHALAEWLPLHRECRPFTADDSL